MNNQGIILPTVLIFLMMMSMLAMTALVVTQLEIRMSRNTINTVREFEAAETGLLAAEKTLQSTSFNKCLISLQAKPWQSKTSCTVLVDKNLVHYVIEPFPQFSQRYVWLQNNRLAAVYYRITAWVSNHDNLPTILQSTYAMPGQSCADCDIRIQIGRMSWRELIVS